MVARNACWGLELASHAFEDGGLAASGLLSQWSGGTAPATRDSVAKTSYFLEHPLSGGDNGRDRLFKVWSGLSWLGEKPD